MNSPQNPTKELAEKEKQRKIDFGMVFNSEVGQRVLSSLDKFCGYHHPCFVPDSPLQTAFQLGTRNVALYIHHTLEAECTP